MEALLESLPWLLAMLVLVGCSAFFSASEAAFFSLREPDRRMLAAGRRAQRVAAALLAEPDRLLSAVLFWNLMVNMAYFAAASIVGFRLQRGAAGDWLAAYAVGGGSVLTLIFFSEMLPKTLAVIAPRRLAAWFSLPLAAAVRAVDPVMPVLRVVNLLSRRLFWPRFRPEPYLEVADLERAIELARSDAEMSDSERVVLSNLVAMSDIRVDEWMRPRTQFLAFRPPVSLADLKGEITPSGYLLITEPDGDEVTAAIDLRHLAHLPDRHLERHASPVLYLPWCATVADALQSMRDHRREVVAVVNEFGETIGILTFEDILDTLFTHLPSRSGRLLKREPIEPVGPGVWRVTGVTSLRRLGRYLGLELPRSKNTTMAGVVQEVLQRLPAPGDSGRWGPFEFRVVESLDRAYLLVELRLIEQAGQERSE